MSQAFKIPACPVDTHIHRLAQRWGLTSGKNVQQTERDLKRLFPKEHWNSLHLQMIYYGREFCSARGCDGTRCDICRGCYSARKKPKLVDRKSTRLNSSHVANLVCRLLLEKKKKNKKQNTIDNEKSNKR